MTRPLVVLVGPPGAGKTTVGRLLAERLGATFRDTDDDVVTAVGRSIADVFLEDGEARFRELERAAVVAALRGHEGVLALGGGAVLDPATRADLSGPPTHRVAFLDVTIAHAAPRIGLSSARPLLVGNPRAQWTRLMDARRPLYQEVATVAVQTGGVDADEVARRVAEGLGVPA